MRSCFVLCFIFRQCIITGKLTEKQEKLEMRNTMEQNQKKEQNQKEQIDQERREARRKRRIRNQAMAYATVLLFLVVVAAGVVFGVNYLTAESKKKAQENQDKLDAMIGTEEALPEPSSEPSTEETVAEPTPEQRLDELVSAGIEAMALEDKVAGLFLVTPESITGVNAAVKAGNGTKDALAKYSVGGVIYNTRNIQNENQLKEMIETTNLYANYPLFIAIEDEGGKVSPLEEKGLVEKVAAGKEYAKQNDSSKAYETGSTMGTYLADYGFNLNLAPVADLNSVDHSVMETRAYGDEATMVIPYVTGMVQGLEEQKVSSCLKHFPGLGATAQSVEEGLASSDRTAEDFRANEFQVFQAGIDAGADLVMVSHMSVPSLTGDNTPCSMSSAVVTDILRGELGFDGVVITDVMNLKAVSEYYGADEGAVLALRAGCDMILMPEDFEKAYQGVLEAVQTGVISEDRINDSLKRIYRIKYADRVEE